MISTKICYKVDHNKGLNFVMKKNVGVICNFL